MEENKVVRFIANRLELLYRLKENKPIDFKLIGKEEAVGKEVGEPLTTHVYPAMYDMAMYAELGTMTFHVLRQNLRKQVNAYCVVESNWAGENHRYSVIQPCFIEE